MQIQIREVSFRYRKSQVSLLDGESFHSSEQIFRAFQDQFLEPVEVFRVLYLDGKNRMLCFEGLCQVVEVTANPRHNMPNPVPVQQAQVTSLQSAKALSRSSR